MPSVWTYPWTLLQEGIDESLSALEANGVDAINCAAHYHSVRALQPRMRKHLFESYSGGAYFDPTDDLYANTPIQPLVNEIEGTTDPFGDIVQTAGQRDVDVNAWTVCHHNSRLAETHPEYRIEDVFGNSHGHSFCPSQEPVQQYFEAVIANIAAYQPNEIQLEAIGFPSIYHGHDMTFGHPKRQVLTSETEEWLLSQCFCDGCLNRADEYGYEIRDAQETIQEIIQTSFDRPHSDPCHLSSMRYSHDAIDRLFRFRAAVIERYLERLVERAGKTPVNAYLMDGFGSDPDDGWPAGVVLDELDRIVDRITVLCYVSDPDVAKERLDTARRSIDSPIDVGLTLDPDCITNKEEYEALVAAVESKTDGRIHTYHHSLMTETQLEWVGSAFGSKPE